MLASMLVDYFGGITKESDKEGPGGGNNEVVLVCSEGLLWVGVVVLVYPLRIDVFGRSAMAIIL